MKFYDSNGALKTSADGDTLHIDWNPTNYTPDSSPAEAVDVDSLTAHLKGIDTGIVANATDEAFVFFFGGPS